MFDPALHVPHVASSSKPNHTKQTPRSTIVSPATIYPSIYPPSNPPNHLPSHPPIYLSTSASRTPTFKGSSNRSISAALMACHFHVLFKERSDLAGRRKTKLLIMTPVQFLQRSTLAFHLSINLYTCLVFTNYVLIPLSRATITSSSTFFPP